MATSSATGVKDVKQSFAAVWKVIASHKVDREGTPLVDKLAANLEFLNQVTAEDVDTMLSRDPTVVQHTFLPQLVNLLWLTCYHSELLLNESNFHILLPIFRILQKITVTPEQQAAFLKVCNTEVLKDGGLTVIHCVLYQLTYCHPSRASQPLWVSGLWDCTQPILHILSGFDRSDDAFVDALLAMPHLEKVDFDIDPKLLPSSPFLEDFLNCAVMLEDALGDHLVTLPASALEVKDHGSFCLLLQDFAKIPSAGEFLTTRKHKVWKLLQLQPFPAMPPRRCWLGFGYKVDATAHLVRLCPQLRQSVAQHGVVETLDKCWTTVFTDFYSSAFGGESGSGTSGFSEASIDVFIYTFAARFVKLLWALCEGDSRNIQLVLQRGTLTSKFVNAVEWSMAPAVQDMPAANKQLRRLLVSNRFATAAQASEYIHTLAQRVGKAQHTAELMEIRYIQYCVTELSKHLRSAEVQAQAAEAALLREMEGWQPTGPSSASAATSAGGSRSSKKKGKKKKK